jgi:Cdc6-like AAA superfamily ATPase
MTKFTTTQESLMTQTIAPSPRSLRDQLIAAYLNPEATDPFTGVVATNQIWQPDPFDVEKIHQHARQAYLHLLDRVSQSQQLSAGQFLLILGQAGSGKTHLLRALRVQTHQEQRGYCAYLTLNTRVISYTGYILSKLVESLEQLYLPDGRETGLSRLVSRFIQELQLDANDRDLLTSNTLEGKELADHLWKCANRVVRSSELRKVGVEFAVALLATQTVAETAAISWLRGEELPPYQRELLGGIPQPQTQGDASLLKIIENFGLILRQLDQGALVLLVDQLEELVELDKQDQDKQHFNEVVSTLITINERVPNSFIVLSCLEDHFDTVCASLPKPKLHRLDKDHQPVKLLTPPHARRDSRDRQEPARLFLPAAGAIRRFRGACGVLRRSRLAKTREDVCPPSDRSPAHPPRKVDRAGALRGRAPVAYWLDTAEYW